MKRKLDNRLPPDRMTEYFAPQIRKGFTERIKTRAGLSGKMSEAWTSFKDNFMMREDEDEFGNKILHSGEVSTDFSGREINFLPVYYQNKINNTSDLSLDTTTSMIIYADMANNFGEMSKIVDAFEIGKDVIANMNIGASRGNRLLKDALK